MAISSINQLSTPFDNSFVPVLLPGFAAAQARLGQGPGLEGLPVLAESDPNQRFESVLAQTGQILSDVMMPPKSTLTPEMAEKIRNFSPEEKDKFVRFCKGVQDIADKGRAEGKTQEQIDQDIKNAFSEAPVEDGKLQSPLDKGSYTVSQEEMEGGHPGIDLAAAGGTPIHAAGAGKVIKANPNTDGSGYGNYVVIDHGNGLQTLYGHMQSAPAVQEGDTVQKGQNIGVVGSTGESTGNHLHFEVNQNGKHLNPRDQAQLA